MRAWNAIGALGGAAVFLTLLAGGCVVIEPEPPPSPVDIEFVNNTNLSLTPNFYFSDSATSSSALFVFGFLNTSFITRPVKELRAGETGQTRIECDRVLSLGVSQPKLFEGATLTVITSSDQIFLLKDRDFACGDSLRFVYTLEEGELRVRLE